MADSIPSTATLGLLQSGSKARLSPRSKSRPMRSNPSASRPRISSPHLAIDPEPSPSVPTKLSWPMPTTENLDTLLPSTSSPGSATGPSVIPRVKKTIPTIFSRRSSDPSSPSSPLLPRTPRLPPLLPAFRRPMSPRCWSPPSFRPKPTNQNRKPPPPPALHLR